MWSREEIVEIINAHQYMFDKAFVTHKATDEDIKEAEKILGIKIPADYVWYLKTFGHGGCMFEFMGVGLNGRIIFAEETLKERENGLPNNLLIFQNCDEFYDCINVDDGSIVTWSEYDNAGIIEVADDFCQYFYETIEAAIENFD